MQGGAHAVPPESCPTDWNRPHYALLAHLPSPPLLQDPHEVPD